MLCCVSVIGFVIRTIMSQWIDLLRMNVMPLKRTYKVHNFRNEKKSLGSAQRSCHQGTANVHNSHWYAQRSSHKKTLPVKFDRQGHSCNFYGGFGPTTSCDEDDTLRQ